jgi:hypothetical protein
MAQARPKKKMHQYKLEDAVVSGTDTDAKKQSPGGNTQVCCTTISTHMTLLHTKLSPAYIKIPHLKTGGHEQV